MRIKNREALVSHGNRKGREMALDIIEAGLSAGNPYRNTLKLVRLEGDTLIFHHPDMEPEGDPNSGPAVYDLSKTDRIFVFGIGKGIQYIVKALEEVLGDRITGGFVIGKHGDEIILNRLEVILAGHPVPDENCLIGCKRILDIAKEAKLTERDLVITAMGNGLSSLCTLPIEGITLEEIKKYTQLCLIDCGIATDEFNYLRNQIDQIRAGRYARAMHPAKMVNLMGITPNPFMAYATRMGCTNYEALMQANFWLSFLPDCTSAEEAIEIATKWGVLGKLPASIREAILHQDPANKPVTYDEYKNFNVRIFGVMPETLTALQAAVDKAKEYGFSTHIMTRNTLCEAAPIGHFMAQVALHCAKHQEPFKPPCAIFATGELLVTVNGETGIGGTNQEYCLAASLILKGSKNVIMTAVDTDGTDGPGGHFHSDATALGITNLTGGIVDGYTAIEAVKKGVDIFGAIKRHDSSQALWRLDSGIAAVQNISVADLHCTLVMED